MRIDIVDFFLKPDEVRRWQSDVLKLDWNIAEYDIYNNQRYLSGMSANLDDQGAEVREFFDERVLAQAYEITGINHKIIRAYVNAWKANEPSFPHTDACHTTCLIYLNLDYDIMYGGETIFYTEGRDAQYAVTPVPGRAVFFDGNILHRATPFNHFYNGYRHTLAYKLGE